MGCNPHLVKGSGVLHLTPKTQRWLEIYKKDGEQRRVLGLGRKQPMIQECVCADKAPLRVEPRIPGAPSWPNRPPYKHTCYKLCLKIQDMQC